MMNAEEIDTNLYSRQIGTIGMDTMRKLMQLKILIIGLRGLGIEIAKNIILAGPKKVSLFDPEISKMNDLGSNCFLSEEDVKKEKRRDESCLLKLSKLNINVNVDIMEGNNIMQKIINYNLTLISEFMNKEKLFIIDDECRKNKIGFIYFPVSIRITSFFFLFLGNT